MNVLISLIRKIVSIPFLLLAEGQVGWSFYHIWYETERVHASLGYQTPRQRLAEGVSMKPGYHRACGEVTR